MPHFDLLVTPRIRKSSTWSPNGSNSDYILNYLHFDFLKVEKLKFPNVSILAEKMITSDAFFTAGRGQWSTARWGPTSGGPPSLSSSLQQGEQNMLKFFHFIIKKSELLTTNLTISYAVPFLIYCFWGFLKTTSTGLLFHLHFLFLLSNIQAEDSRQSHKWARPFTIFPG